MRRPPPQTPEPATIIDGSDDGKYAISVLMPSIRSALLPGVYASIANSFHGKWELVIVSPYPLPDVLKNKSNIVYIEDHGSPIRARQIGLERARGDYICYAADDVLFYKNALDLAYGKLALAHYNDIVLGKYCEGSEANPYMRSDIYYLLSHHALLTETMSRIPGGDKYWLLNTGLVSTHLMKLIGGFDCRFEACAMACVDLSIRLQNFGAEIIVQNEPFFHSTHLPGVMGDHEPIHVAQTTHDIPLFMDIYKEGGNNRQIISLDNWQSAPDWWTRRFGEKHEGTLCNR
jgi:glycosyltransferase involved in cell wall biosynthesis